MAHSFFAQQKTATTFNDLFKIVHDKGNRDYYWILVSFIPAKAFTVAPPTTCIEIFAGPDQGCWYYSESDSGFWHIRSSANECFRKKWRTWPNMTL